MPLNMIEMLFYRSVLSAGELGSSDALVDQAVYELESRDLKINYQGQELTGQDMRARLCDLEHEWRFKLLPLLRLGGALDFA
jgi:hypothetical protein